MRVLVLGSGVIGITTAWYLARQGIAVTVVDRQEGPALETSFANAGQISPGYSTPWAAPGIPTKALKWLLQRKHAPLAIRLDGSAFQLQWLYSLWRNCNPKRYAVNKERMLRLAEYSRDCLRLLRADTEIGYEGRQRGTLQVFRTSAQLEAVARDVEVLREVGVDFDLMDSERLTEAEPALASSKPRLVGALRLPGDETGDCHLFTQALAERCRALGVEFLYGCRIEGFVHADGSAQTASVKGADRAASSGTAAQKPLLGLRVSGPGEGEPARTLTADHYVLALGSYSRAMAATLGISLPVYPVKGYSLTAPIAREAAAPVSTVMDETYKIAVTRFDQRIRVGGMAEVAGFDLRLDPRRLETLSFVLEDLFPGAADLTGLEFWTGLRPMTPDGTPIVGATPIPNLWTNTGHGTLGWTMACGSGKLLSDLMTGRAPEISARGLGMDRYQRSGGHRASSGTRSGLSGQRPGMA